MKLEVVGCVALCTDGRAGAILAAGDDGAGLAGGPAGEVVAVHADAGGGGQGELEGGVAGGAGG